MGNMELLGHYSTSILARNTCITSNYWWNPSWCLLVLYYAYWSHDGRMMSLQKNSWLGFTFIIWMIAIPLQLITLFGINYYTKFPSYDFYTHWFWNGAIFASILLLIKFPKRYDYWRYWFPLQVGIMVAFELFELYVSKNNITFHIQMIYWVIKATVENSIYDVAVGIVSMPAIAFFYEMICPECPIRFIPIKPFTNDDIEELCGS